MASQSTCTRFILAAALATGLAGTAGAQQSSPRGVAPVIVYNQPVVVYDQTGKFDKSFNEAAYNGMTEFSRASSIAFKEVEPKTQDEFQRAMEIAAQNGNHVIAVGFAAVERVQAAAAKFPTVRFTLIDGVVDAPNVRSILFKEHESGYLVGLLAGMKTQSKVVGFIGGLAIPPVERFLAGYVQGVKAVDPAIEVLVDYAPIDTPEQQSRAFRNAFAGVELAEKQLAQGADVFFAAAGATGFGVYKVAGDNKKFAIGVDSNQNYLYPGAMLTSALKRIDVAIRLDLEQSQAGKWQPGITVLGVKDGAIDAALDRHNESLVTPAMRTRLDQARADLAAEKIKVSDRPPGS